MKMTKIILCLTFITWNVAYGQPVDSIEKGRVIASEADKRSSGFVDSKSSLNMVLRGKNGSERIRSLKMSSMERKDDGDWTMTTFDDPPDVKGTSLLIYAHGLDPDDQWIYLPEVKRVKRISSKNKSGRFMGSEFAFEDLVPPMLEKYSYKYLRQEVCGSLTCFVTEWMPLYPYSGYKRLVYWHDTEEYRIQKTEYFDRSNSLLKTLVVSDYELLDDKFWRAHLLEMTNHKTGSSTLLKFNDIKFGFGLSERHFDLTALKRSK